MPETDSTAEICSDVTKKIRKRRSRSSSPRRGSATSNEVYENGAVRIDVYLAIVLFAAAVLVIKLLPKS
nr:hypothetical protein BgiMline_018870 [Biomphalaria glabrata]